MEVSGWISLYVNVPSWFWVKLLDKYNFSHFLSLYLRQPVIYGHRKRTRRWYMIDWIIFKTVVQTYASPVEPIRRVNRVYHKRQQLENEKKNIISKFLEKVTWQSVELLIGFLTSYFRFFYPLLFEIISSASTTKGKQYCSLLPIGSWRIQLSFCIEQRQRIKKKIRLPVPFR